MVERKTETVENGSGKGNMIVIQLKVPKNVVELIEELTKIEMKGEKIAVIKKRTVLREALYKGLEVMVMTRLYEKRVIEEMAGKWGKENIKVTT